MKRTGRGKKVNSLPSVISWHSSIQSPPDWKRQIRTKKFGYHTHNLSSNYIWAVPNVAF
jgi:hypothetical protein